MRVSRNEADPTLRAGRVEYSYRESRLFIEASASTCLAALRPTLHHCEPGSCPNFPVSTFLRPEIVGWVGVPSFLMKRRNEQ